MNHWLTSLAAATIEMVRGTPASFPSKQTAYELTCLHPVALPPHCVQLVILILFNPNPPPLTGFSRTTCVDLVYITSVNRCVRATTLGMQCVKDVQDSSALCPLNRPAIKRDLKPPRHFRLTKSLWRQMNMAMVMMKVFDMCDFTIVKNYMLNNAFQKCA